MQRTLKTEHKLLLSDQTPFFYRRIRPQEASLRAAVLIIHGMGEHGGRYLPIAEFLAARGFECWIPDLRGFGLSGGRRGFVNCLAEYEEDLRVLSYFAQRSTPNLPFFILGHSFGGLLAARLSTQVPRIRIHGVILSSPFFGLKLNVSAWQEILGQTASFLCPSFTQKDGIDSSQLTHDPLITKTRNQDPLIHGLISARLYTEMMSALKSVRSLAGSMEIPALVLQAGEDLIVSRSATESFFGQLASRDKVLKIYEGWYHEILNEIGRQDVFAEIERWMVKRI